MCDGIADETTWTITIRDTGRPLEGAGGFAYVFSDESDAIAFVRSRSDAAALDIVAVPVPEI
jgi:hypothetical protein